MAGKRTADRHLKQLLRMLGWLDVESEITAALQPRSGPEGCHPSRYAIEEFACGTGDGQLRLAVGSHLLICPTCKAEMQQFRSLLPSPPTALHVPPLLFSMPKAAAAAGGALHQRVSPDAAIRVVPLSESPGRVVIAIQLKNVEHRPRLMQLVRRAVAAT